MSSGEKTRADVETSNDGWSILQKADSLEWNTNIEGRRRRIIKKMGRLIADILGIGPKKSEEWRKREAMHIALSEHHEEEAARREEEAARREKEALERDMASARDTFDIRDRLRKQRIQEVVERDLNSHLLTVDDLEMAVVSENPEIQKRSIHFEDTDIPVYDLRGLPFSLLSTTVDYRSANKPGEIGTETFRKILEDPSVWTERRDEAEKAIGFGTRNADARGDTISTSYWNSERSINSHVSGNLIYGFASVRADSILSVTNGDGGTSNMAGNAETALQDMDAIKQLEGTNGIYNYNEVLLRRYTENGIPKKPDYIIVEDGRITEESLRSAAFFGIPIINIERSAYAEKAEKRGEELLASISEDDTYEEMDEKIAELLSMSMFKTVYHTLEGIGRNRDIPRPRRLDPTPLEKRCLEVSQMEQLKRLDFIKSTLEEAIRNIESATEKGLPAEQNLPGFDFFNISIQDVQNQLERTEYVDRRDFSAPGNCNAIRISFRLKGSPRYVSTSVYDGKRIYKAEEALANTYLTEEDIKNADSSFYDALEPVVLRYFAAIRNNRRLRKTV